MYTVQLTSILVWKSFFSNPFHEASSKPNSLFSIVFITKAKQSIEPARAHFTVYNCWRWWYVHVNKHNALPSVNIELFWLWKGEKHLHYDLFFTCMLFSSSSLHNLLISLVAFDISSNILAVIKCISHWLISTEWLPLFMPHFTLFECSRYHYTLFEHADEFGCRFYIIFLWNRFLNFSMPKCYQTQKKSLRLNRIEQWSEGRYKKNDKFERLFLSSDK